MDIKGFIETSFLDWPGQVASVIFLAGCNFRCPFCHNHGLVLNRTAFRNLHWPDIKDRLARFKGWIDGVVLTGGEPTLTPELPGLIGEIKAEGFKVKLDTNGGRPDVLKDLLDQRLLDHVAMDVKAPLDELAYARAAGRPGFLGAVKESLACLQKAGLPHTLRTTVVPGLHSEGDIYQLAEQLKDAPEWKIQKFKPESTLDESYRRIEPWNSEDFEALTCRALAIKTEAAQRTAKGLPIQLPENRFTPEKEMPIPVPGGAHLHKSGLPGGLGPIHSA